MMGRSVPANRRRIFSVTFLAVATVLTLVSCNSSTPPSDEQPTVPAVRLTAEQVQERLGDYARGLEDAEVVSDAQLRSSIPKAQEWLEDVKVNPSKCGITFAAPISEQLKNSVMGAVKGDDQLITVSVYPDPAALQKSWDAQMATSSECSRYSVSAKGETRAYHLAPQKFTSTAPMNDSYVVTGSDGKKTSQQLIIRSASANVLIGIQAGTKRQTTADQLNSATETVNAILSKLN